MPRKRTIAAMLCLLVLAATPSFAAAAQQEVVNQTGPAEDPLPPTPADDPVPTPTEAAAQEEEEPKIKFTPYGYIKVDASWDSSTIDPGDFARWVLSPDFFEEHDHFNLTARQTRLGLRISGGGSDNLVASGRVEIDFYGGGAENKNLPMLRHAYAELNWQDRDLVLLGGQTSDVISPLVPTTLNYTVAWWVGNIGYRHPQIRVTKGFDVGLDSKLTLAAAAVRTIADDFRPTEPGDAGADSGLPSIQGRVGYAWTMAGNRAGVGFSSHWGRENPHLESEPDHERLEFDSWSANVDFTFPLTDRVTLKGEVFTGSNLDDFFGGIGKGINFDKQMAIDSTGGWVSVDFRANDQILTSFGYGMEDPDDEALNDNNRSKNSATWANFIYDITSHVRTGVELSYWRTHYKALEMGKAFRIQYSLIYSF
jgi:hypothetical protein